MKKVKYDEENYKIWFWKTTEDGVNIAARYTKEYKTKGWATRVAKQIYEPAGYSWYVSKRNIFRKKCPKCGKEYFVTDFPLSVGNTCTVSLRNKFGKRFEVSCQQICDECFNEILAMFNEEMREEMKDER